MKLYYHPVSTTCRPIMLWAKASELFYQHFVTPYKDQTFLGV